MNLRRAPGWDDGKGKDPIAYQQRASERGSFIVEALVGGAIFMCVTVSLYAAFSMGFKSSRLSQEDLRADQIMVENLETVRVYDWSKITSGSYVPATSTAYFTPPSGTNTIGKGVPYTVGISVTQPSITESYSNTLRQVTVNVSWVSSGINRSRSMTTLVSQNGIQTYKN